MSILKCVNDVNNDRDSFEYIVKYVTTKPYTDFNSDVATKGCRKEAIIQDMTAVKEAYHQNDGKLYEHAVLSITPDSRSRHDSDYMEIGRRIANHYIGYQCVYALHKDTRTRHLHFIFNTVNYKDRKKLSQGPPDLNRIKMYVNTVLEEYDLDPIKSNPKDIIDTRKHFFSNGWRFLEIDNDQPDDRDMFLVPPPKSEENDNNGFTEDYGYSSFGAYSAWFSNDISGGYDMKPQFNYPTSISQSAPNITQAATMTANQGNNSGNGLNLVNVNNVKLNSLDDLGQATNDMNNTFNNSAKAGAEAIAALRQRGVSDGVTVTTINNYYINSGNSSAISIFDTIDSPYEEKD